MDIKQIAGAVEFFAKSNRNWSIEENANIKALVDLAQLYLECEGVFAPKNSISETRIASLCEISFNKGRIVGYNTRAGEDALVLANKLSDLEDTIHDFILEQFDTEINDILRDNLSRFLTQKIKEHIIGGEK